MTPASLQSRLAAVTAALEDVLLLVVDNPRPTGETMGQLVFVPEERREAWKAALTIGLDTGGAAVQDSPS